MKAKASRENDSPIIKGRVYRNRKTDKYSCESLVMDTGCTKPIISEAIVEDLNIQVKPLSRNMTIVDASGMSLDITGTVKVYVSSRTQETGGSSRVEREQN